MTGLREMAAGVVSPASDDREAARDPLPVAAAAAAVVAAAAASRARAVDARAAVAEGPARRPDRVIMERQRPSAFPAADCRGALA